MLIFRRHQSDGLLGGQPQLRANLRGSQSPQRHTAKSSLEEDLKKLITLDSPPPTTNEEKVQGDVFDKLLYYLAIWRSVSISIYSGQYWRNTL